MKKPNVAAQEMARLSHAKSPRPKEFYQEMNKKSHESKKAKKELKKYLDDKGFPSLSELFNTEI